MVLTNIDSFGIITAITGIITATAFISTRTVNRNKIINGDFMFINVGMHLQVLVITFG